MADAICSVEDCNLPTLCRGWCAKHYYRWSRHGDPLKTLRITAPRGSSDFERFSVQVDQSAGIDACHPWRGGRNGDGYGLFNLGGTSIAASRWLMGHLRGEALARDEQACHHCDNPPCVNPRHLYVGDRSMNMRDMVSKGRHRNRHSAA